MLLTLRGALRDQRAVEGNGREKRKGMDVDEWMLHDESAAAPWLPEVCKDTSPEKKKQMATADAKAKHWVPSSTIDSNSHPHPLFKHTHTHQPPTSERSNMERASRQWTRRKTREKRRGQSATCE